MFKRFLLILKISRLSNRIKCMENDIMRYRQDMMLVNDLYYCGRGDVESYINEWSQEVHFKIEACHRLMIRFDRQLDRLNGVVGA